MNANEALPWLFLVLAAGTFLIGAYLLVSDRQAKAAGAESNKIKFFNIEIESSTSGTTLIILSILATVLIISLGIAPDDGGDGGSNISGQETDDTDPPETDDTDPPVTDPPDAKSGLTIEDNLVRTVELSQFTSGQGLAWTEARAEERPGLNCLQDYLPKQNGALSPPVWQKWRSIQPDGSADAATTAVKFESEDDARNTYDRIVKWMNDCGEVPALDGGRQLDVNQAGSGHDVNGRIYWRNYPFESPPSCIPCVMTDSQAVGRVDDTVVIFSIAWVDQSGTFVADGGPIEDVMQRALALAD